MEKRPWAAFCMSTYKRPAYLESQLKLLLTQTFSNYEIIVSDNDPESSGEHVVQKLNNQRIRYFKNGDNLGMINSFNKSIERATAEFVVMVTDDDPVAPELLKEMHQQYNDSPGSSVYAGFSRKFLAAEQIEKISAENFISEILDPIKTPWLLWSSCVIRRDVLLALNGIPNYGSPHLADHALIAMAGSLGGGVIMNKRFSSLTSHDTNFSKVNFGYYVDGCKGFYGEMKKFCSENNVSRQSMDVVKKHLYHWLIGNMFNLKRYYTVSAPDEDMVRQVERCADEIMQFDFMKGVTLRYKLKNTIFHTKKMLRLLKKA
ncbi:MAG: glycosyltransferase family 2 protein [Chitinophagaceae bacterium]|nr:glycosyltransferase family 2 protein [Chitinophagaceae bacterium]